MGSGNVATPLDISMLAHGLTSDTTSITPALAATQADGAHSDGEGKPDIDGLMGARRRAACDHGAVGTGRFEGLRS
jgi:hypothetical protein